MEEVSKSFLALVKLGLGHPVERVPDNYDWLEIKALAVKQGLLAVVLDGIENLYMMGLPKTVLPEKKLTMQWVGEVMKNYEHRNDMYCKVISEMAKFYNDHGLKMMILKGFVCSLDWPKPEYRPCGDIDIWQFGKQKEGDALVEKEKGIKVDNSHHHHTSFYWRGFLVENHYDFINVHQHRSNKKFERLLKELGDEKYSGSMEVNGQKVYLPSANLHALFLLKHLMLPFSAESITLRQLLDWAFHAKAHTKEIDWTWMKGVLEEYGMLPAYRIFNAICIEDLGFVPEIFPSEQCDASMKQRVLNEILSPEFFGETPKSLVGRIVFKFRRWKANAWKHRLCYNETMWSAFWSGIWNHLLKPESI